MAFTRLVLVLAGMVAVSALPCLLALLATADEVVGRLVRGIRGVLRRLRSLGRWVLRRLPLVSRYAREEPPEEEHPVGPPIEQVAADLRRLARQRVGMSGRSTLWFAAVQRAYDDRLRQACRGLGVEEHLAELDGLDLEIERVRVEGALRETGLVLPAFAEERR